MAVSASQLPETWLFMKHSCSHEFVHDTYFAGKILLFTLYGELPTSCTQRSRSKSTETVSQGQIREINEKSINRFLSVISHRMHDIDFVCSESITCHIVTVSAMYAYISIKIHQKDRIYPFDCWHPIQVLQAFRYPRYFQNFLYMSNLITCIQSCHVFN